MCVVLVLPVGERMAITLTENGSKETPAPEEEKAGRDAAPVSGKALLVDDESSLLEVLANILQHMGYEVIKAVDGVDALQKLKENVDDISIVLMDITMPRMDGTEAYGHMRYINPNLPIIICSGYSESDISSRFIEDENLHFVRKPYRFDQIASKLAEALDS